MITTNHALCQEFVHAAGTDKPARGLQAALTVRAATIVMPTTRAGWPHQLVAIGILAALGGAEPQLTVHVNAALNVGLTPTEIIGAIIHAVPCIGFPRALNALFTAKAVFAERHLLPVASAPR